MSAPSKPGWYLWGGQPAQIWESRELYVTTHGSGTHSLDEIADEWGGPCAAPGESPGTSDNPGLGTREPGWAEVHRAQGDAMNIKAEVFFAAELHGFESWTHVVRCAREGHGVAIELLCRRVERGL